MIGSGPIVIGQACEFDYSGSQALRVLRAEGIRTVLINSNPATIMTDAGWADRTYLEPLDVEGVRRRCCGASAPTRSCRRSAARPRSTWRPSCRPAGILEELGIELIGASYDAIRRAEDRELFAETMASVGPARADERDRDGMQDARAALASGALQLPRRDPARVHARRPRRRVRAHARRARGGRDPRPAREPDRPGAARGVRRGLGRVRARGHPRPQGQRRDRLLDRERRPHGRAHRRLGHRRAGADALRPRVPAPARRRRRRHPRGRCRDRRLERPVRAEPRARRPGRDRDEPARVPVVRARLQGDRLPDRQGRHQARDRLHARRDPERHHPHDAGRVRADARLRRRQAAAVRVREVPRRRHRPHHPDEVGRRGDGHRPHVRRGVGQGDALARARRPPAHVRVGGRARVGPFDAIQGRLTAGEDPAALAAESSCISGSWTSGSGSPTPSACSGARRSSRSSRRSGGG